MLVLGSVVALVDNILLEHTTVPSSISVYYPALTSVLACMHHMYRPYMYMYLVVHPS